MPTMPEKVSRHHLAWYKRRTFAEREQIEPIAPATPQEWSRESQREIWDMHCMGLDAMDIADDCGVDEATIVSLRNHPGTIISKEVHDRIHTAYMDRQREGTRIFNHMPAAISTRASREKARSSTVRQRTQGE